MALAQGTNPDSNPNMTHFPRQAMGNNDDAHQHLLGLKCSPCGALLKYEQRINSSTTIFFFYYFFFLKKKFSSQFFTMMKHNNSYYHVVNNNNNLNNNDDDELLRPQQLTARRHFYHLLYHHVSPMGLIAIPVSPIQTRVQ